MNIIKHLCLIVLIFGSCTDVANNQDFHTLWPIPQDEIDRATNQVRQNPGF